MSTSTFRFYSTFMPITALLPGVVTPGMSTTVFGKFPAGVSVTIGATPIAIETRRDALEFIVPRSLNAGEYSVQVSSAGATLSAPLTVDPKIENLTLTGDRLEVEGVGWSAGALASIWLAGRSYIPTRIADRLTVTVPSDLPYGSLAVRVAVGARSSATLSLDREAGRLAGAIALPASGSSLAIASSNSSIVLPAVSSVLLIAQPELYFAQTAALLGELPCRLERAVAFSLTVARCASVGAARVAKDTLEPHHDALEIRSLRPDQPVSPSDGLRTIPQAEGPFPGAGQWYLEREGIPAAWAMTRGAGVTVAVVDTGVDLTHPDLKANLLPGWDFVDNDGEPQDTVGHGTHVAGLVAANGRALGVAPLARLLPIRALPGLSGGSAIDVANGVLWAVDALPGRPNPNRASVINLSLGSDAPSLELQLAINTALERGALVVAAAGNNGGALNYPAAWPGVIAVTALAGPTLPYQPAYASRGVGLSVTAYGGDSTQDQDRDGVPDGILSTDLGEGGYGLRMGTSMAAPQAAGLLALGLARGLPTSNLPRLLAGSALDLGPVGYDLRFGYGLISGALALSRTPLTYAVAQDPSGRVLSASVVGDDLRYDLGNLPPGLTVTIRIAVDINGNGRLAESGEPIGTSQPQIVTTRTTITLPTIALSTADGSAVYTLEARP